MLSQIWVGRYGIELYASECLNVSYSNSEKIKRVQVRSTWTVYLVGTEYEIMAIMTKPHAAHLQ